MSANEHEYEPDNSTLATYSLFLELIRHVQPVSDSISHVDAEICSHQKQHQRVPLPQLGSSLTMTRHGDSHVYVDLQLMRDTFVYGKRVRGLAKEILAQFAPDEKADCQRQQDCQETASGRVRLVCRESLWESIEFSHGRQLQWHADGTRKSQREHSRVDPCPYTPS